MRNPAGVECRYFYGNYHRGREHEECRLIGDGWSRDVCGRCPVPGFLRHNACPHMKLTGQVRRRPFLGPRVVIRAYCPEYGLEVKAPAVGCGHCHEHRKDAPGSKGR